MADATGSDGTMYALNTVTTRDQFNSVCRIVDVNGNLQGLCDDTRKHNLQAYFPPWVANRTRVLITNSV